MTGADLLALLKKRPAVSAALLICVVCGALLYFRGDVAAAARESAEAKDKESQKIEANVRDGTGLAEEVASLQEAVRQIEARLVQPDNLALNLQIFYRLEKETGVKILDVRQAGQPAPVKGAAKPLYTPVGFDVNIEGDYAQVLGFIRRLENGGQFCRLLNVVLSKNTAVTAANKAMRATLSLELLGTTP